MFKLITSAIPTTNAQEVPPRSGLPALLVIPRRSQPCCPRGSPWSYTASLGRGRGRGSTPGRGLRFFCFCDPNPTLGLTPGELPGVFLASWCQTQSTQAFREFPIMWLFERKKSRATFGLFLPGRCLTSASSPALPEWSNGVEEGPASPCFGKSSR